MIEQATIERIFETARIEDVVGDFVSLKKRGVNYIGNCPFHNEKTPSFIVSPSKNICKCFGCGKGGNSVRFLMDLEQMDYVDALKYLARKYSIEIVEKEETPEERNAKNKRESLLVVSGFAQDYFFNSLKNTSEGRSVGLSYFRERGFRDDIIERFGLGYCPDQKDSFYQEALKKGYKTEYLVETGLVIAKENYAFDRFRGRVMFPIHGVSGKVIGFGGRVLKTDNKKIAKYQNSPESEIYNKSKVLYGLYFAKRSIVQQDKCFLVEGYTDVISMHQCGVENVVASSGTSLTTEQIRLIKRFTPNITIIYDGDPAGIKASFRGIDMILEEGMNVKVMLLPEGEDPDSFSKSKSAEEYRAYISENEKDFISFKSEVLLSEAARDPIKKAQAVTNIVNSVAVIPDDISRSVYIKESSRLLDVDEDAVFSQVKKQRFKKTHGPQAKYVKEKPKAPVVRQTQQKLSEESMLELKEREILRILLLYGGNILYVQEDENGDSNVLIRDFLFAEITQGGLDFVHEINKNAYTAYFYAVSEEIKDLVAFFVNHPDHGLSLLFSDIISYEEIKELSRIWQKNDSYVETEDMTLAEVVPQTLIDYKKCRVNYDINKISEEIKSVRDDVELMRLLQRQQELQAFKRLLGNDLKRPIG